MKSREILKQKKKSNLWKSIEDDNILTQDNRFFQANGQTIFLAPELKGTLEALGFFGNLPVEKYFNRENEEE